MGIPVLDPLMKLQIHQAAAQLAMAVATNFPDNLMVAEPKNSPDCQTMNLVVWEIHRIFYHAILATMESDNWPTPVMSLDLNNILGPLTNLLGNPAVASMLPMLKSLLGVKDATPTPVTLIPAPGV